MAPKRLSFEFEQTDDVDDKLTAWSGLTLVYEALQALGVADSVRSHVKVSRSRKNLEFDEFDQVAAFVMLLAAGGECVDDLRFLREDVALSRLLEARFPSPESARQFLYQFHEDRLIEEAQQKLPPDRKAYVPEESAPLRALGEVSKDLVDELQRRSPLTCATLDVDGTFQASNKKEAKEHYGEGPGYNPLLATWVEQRLVVFDQMRDGNVPDGVDALDALKRMFARLPATVKERYLRADTALYQLDVLRWLCAEGIQFAIGAHMREGLREACASLPEEGWELIESRPKSMLHVSEVSYLPKDWRPRDGSLRFIVTRTTENQGELFGDATYHAIVTTRPGTPAEVAKWYWEKCGTIEHVHTALKHELGVGIFPCGRFGANAAWLRLNVLTFNLLEAVRRIGPEELKDAKPKRLRLSLFALPALVVNHARRVVARIATRAQRLLASRAALWRPLPEEPTPA